MKAVILFFFFSLFSIIFAYSQDGREYIDSRKNKIYLPQGKRSFADIVTSKVEGKPASQGINSNPRNALSEPDYNGQVSYKESYFSLGCGGEVIFEFQDNGLVDVDGPDLYIFEVGPSLEPVEVYISENNKDWFYVGDASGGTAALDIKNKSDSNKIYYFVKLIDLKKECGGDTQGADIDAVAAIGSSLDETTKNNEIKDSEFADSMHVRNKNIKVKIWDSAKEDGDRVEILLNGKSIIAEQAVSKKGYIFKLNLNLGDNIFEIKALNEGSIAPNTAALLIDDGMNEYQTVLSSKIGNSKKLKITVK